MPSSRRLSRRSSWTLSTCKICRYDKFRPRWDNLQQALPGDYQYIYRTRRLHVASIGDLARGAAGHLVHGWRGNRIAGERRLRGTDPMVNVLPLALLRRQTVPSHAGARYDRQEPAGTLQWPFRSCNEGRENAEGHTWGNRCYVRTAAFTRHPGCVIFPFARSTCYLCRLWMLNYYGKQLYNYSKVIWPRNLKEFRVRTLTLNTRSWQIFQFLSVLWYFIIGCFRMEVQQSG